MNFQNRHRTVQLFHFVVSLFGCLSAYSEKFGQPKNSAGQVDFSSTCPTGQVANNVNVKPCNVCIANKNVYIVNKNVCIENNNVCFVNKMCIVPNNVCIVNKNVYCK